MLRIHEQFFDKAKALEFRREQSRQFPPAIYGTVLRLFRERMTGYWVVAGSRFVT